MLRPRLLAIDWKNRNAYSELEDIVDVETVVARDIRPCHFELDGLRVLAVHDPDIARYAYGAVLIREACKRNIPIFAILTGVQRELFIRYGKNFGVDLHMCNMLNLIMNFLIE